MRRLDSPKGLIAVLLTAVLALQTNSVSPTAAEEELHVLKQTGSAFAAIAKKAVAAVVFIQVEKTIEDGNDQGYFIDPREEFLRRFFGPRGMPQAPRRKSRQLGQGSGFLISKDGYILTNSHIVGDADKITVTLHDGRELRAKRIGSDVRSEVAVIKIEGDGYACLEMGDSDALEIGNWVLAVGNPFGFAETVTAGIVSAKGRSNIGIADYENFIQTDAAINPGNSGGPLLNIEGKVIGINTAILSRTGDYIGISFAIPINMVRKIKDQLVKTGKVTRGYLGVYIQKVTPALAESFGLGDALGILVSDVTKDSAAENAGIRQGDIILKLNGKDVESVGAFRNEVASNPPGTRLKLTFVRKGQEKEVILKTRELPDRSGAVSQKPQVTEELGMTVRDLTDELAAQAGVEGEEGVLVTSVEPGGVAWRAGIRGGILIVSVNRKPVAFVREFESALAEADKNKAILMRIRGQEISRYVTLRLD